jgi:diguanylate cyclase (GGDEF)-like protein
MLTGLVNRREFEARLKRAIVRVAEHKLFYVLACVTLDEFHRVTDTFGENFSDEIIKAVALTLRGRIRERDTLARLRGAEFGLILEGCGVVDAQKLAEDMREAIERLVFRAKGEEIRVTASFGLTGLTEDLTDVPLAVSQADAGRNLAAMEGGNRVVIYGADEEDGEADLGANNLIRAIREDRFRFFLQPIVPINTDAPGAQHYEVFTKLETATGETVGPAFFINEAQRHHLMPVVDRYIIRRAFEEYRKMVELGNASRPVIWSINLSGESLRNAELVHYIREQAAACRVPPHCICFEISEAEAISKFRHAASFIKALKNDGFLISLDDFGPAMGSIGNLSGMEIDFVKIDAKFVAEATRNRIGRGTNTSAPRWA